MLDVVHYQLLSGRDVYSTWFNKLRDAKTRATIAGRLDRLVEGYFGDCKSLGQGLQELRIHFGPGYRVYFAMIGDTCVLLLCAGNKGSQDRDIKKAREYLDDFMRRQSQHGKASETS